MTSTGFTIAKVIARGSGKPDALLELRPGLNVIEGAANTGKTFAWKLIDFMLGASKPPKTFPLADGYTQGLIEILPRAGGTLTLVRSLAGGPASVYPVPIDLITKDTPHEVLAEKHDRRDVSTISGRLLAISGLGGKEIRKDANGAKDSLSFRDVARLAFVDEERIIAERSPVLSNVREEITKNKSTFGLFLTGTDDSAIVAIERREQRKLRLATEMTVLSGLLDDREARFKSFSVDALQLADQRLQLSQAVETATRLVAASQRELDDAVSARDEAWGRLQTLKSKILFLTEQQSRLELLERQYAADEARLESAREAGRFFEQLPSGECPVCGHISDVTGERRESDSQLREFQTACAAEIDKIAVLVRDLREALADLREEKRGYVRDQAELEASLVRANSQIAGLLDRQVKVATEDLSELIARQSRLAEAAHAADEVNDLRARLARAEEQSKVKRPKATFGPKVGAAGTTPFCEVVEATLRAWKFPMRGRVSWADAEFDLVIGGENRGSMGKGYKAVTHAAFSVALLRYCRQKLLPHPGIVMIDSPLNPFKGADRESAQRVNTEVQEAFYTDLANDQSGDQIIVIENTPPPTVLQAKIRHVHFSANTQRPRTGFFPVPPAEGDDLDTSES